MRTLPEWVKPGTAFIYQFGPDNHNNGRKFHIRGIVDDRAVIREWWRHKRRWNYTVEDWIYFNAFAPHIKVVRR
ncbi:hypothetical protein MPL3356_60622 [Mesorhizobium plurifarium]|uniref:Uncharacterized protein n=1 Tax=Mesorhizobium plurifarium TaxID=69974 RepID=A0A090G7H0_MESPL|nr:hypothetical protein MPL3356_60622 [Mesorhizobium plurifarium]